MKKTRQIELLAPAHDAAIAIEAIKHGADAVYMGASKFGARSQAGNTIDDIKRVVEYAHTFGCKVYVTVNTIIYDDELTSVEQLIVKLYNAHVDALIVQDLGILKLDIPPIALHASTQCDIRTPEKAMFLESLGFSQLVLARELSKHEINDIYNKIKVPLECFVHGALCVSYSGRCQVSYALKGRSANRGECAQICRLTMNLIDAQGNVLVRDKHLLSLRDLNLSQNLSDMIDAGASSFKIEGRLKNMDYVKNVVAYYREALDAIIQSSNGMLRRSSFGDTLLGFTPKLDKSFNRSFTTYFFNERHPHSGTPMATLSTPKSQGELIGKVIKARGSMIELDSCCAIANGDGISYFDENGEWNGIRVNNAAGNVIKVFGRLHIKPGTKVYRTFDKAFSDVLMGATAVRKLGLDAKLRYVNGRLCLDMRDASGCCVAHSIVARPLEAAKTPQADRQRGVISKLGDTVFKLDKFDGMDDAFVPVSLLARLRRETVELLTKAHQISYARPLRKTAPRTFEQAPIALISSDNVANHLAANVYREHGTTQLKPALECQGSEAALGTTVMHTRYCLRRELGACLRSEDKNGLPRQLFLEFNGNKLAVMCDCAKCEMQLKLVSTSI